MRSIRYQLYIQVIIVLAFINTVRQGSDYRCLHVHVWTLTYLLYAVVAKFLSVKSWHRVFVNTEATKCILLSRLAAIDYNVIKSTKMSFIL